MKTYCGVGAKARGYAFVTALMLGCLVVTVWAEAVVNSEATSPARNRMDLTGTWRFCADPQDRGMIQGMVGFYNEKQDVSGWQEVTVPCSFSRCVSGKEKYTGAGWFQKEFSVPESWRGKRVRLTFEAVNNTDSVWLNGWRLGDSDHAFLPFGFDVQDGLRFGAKNVLVVRADNRPTTIGIPCPIFWHLDGGILRGVYLETTEKIHVDDLAVLATPGQDAKLAIQVTNAWPQGSRANVQAQITEALSGKVIGRQ